MFSSRPFMALVLCSGTLIGLASLATSEDVAAQPGGSPTTIELDYGNAIPEYANFARVTSTADEVVIDFAFVASSPGESIGPLPVHQRTVMNYYTMKRLAGSLQATLDRYEANFGPLELDVEKRFKK